MNFRSTVAPPDSSRKFLVAFVFVLIFVAAAYEFSELVLAGDMMGFAYVALLGIGGVFANVYVSFIIAVRRKKTIKVVRPPFFVAVMVLVWFGIMQIFNPASTTNVYGLLGVKLFFWYIPLYFVGYALFNSEADLRRFFRVNAWLALIITGLSAAQSSIGPSFLNPATPAEDIRELSTLYRVSPITGLVSYRAPSVFVSAGRYTNYLLIAWVLMLAFTGYLLLRHRRGRNIDFISLAVVYAAILLSGSRGVFLWTAGAALIIVVAFIWGTPRRQREVIRVFRTVQRAALAMGLAIVALLFVFRDGFPSLSASSCMPSYCYCP